jgi:uncharacterized membrane protein YkvA (DUF1232 family)
MLLVIAGVGALGVIWIALVMVLWRQQRLLGGAVDWREIARLVPDVVRLVRRLVVDPAVPRATRWWLVGLLCYLLLPFDLIPDFIPVLGFADDAIAIVIALRLAIAHAGVEAVTRHWPGTPQGLDGLLRLTGPSAQPRSGLRDGRSR